MKYSGNRSFEHECIPALIFPFYDEDDPARGKHSRIINISEMDSISHLRSSVSRYKSDPEIIFNTHKEKWEQETLFFSSTTEICSHPSYLKIIEMGYEALPFIFRELANEPGHWFQALKAITDEDPIPEEKRGRMLEMTEIWLRWWSGNKHRFRCSPECSLRLTT